MNITPRQWLEQNRQWMRIDNVAHAKYQMSKPNSNKTFWKAVLQLLGAE